MKNLIGKTIKDYQILLKIRETATRILYRAYDSRNESYVALEVIKIENIKQAGLLASLREQAAKNAVLIHPNIVSMTDSGNFKGILYFVFNFSPVRTLRRLFNQTLSWKQSAREFVTVAQAMAYAHQQGIVHGSLNPSSIILDENDTPFLFDFGFEQVINNYIYSHSPGAWITGWKYPYATPEQLSGNLIDTRSDVYSMGVILYEWLTGEIPLLDETALGTLFRRMFLPKQGLILKKLNPPVIYELIAKCIAVDPDMRYQSMQEVSIILAREVLGLALTRKIVRNPLIATEGQKKNNRRWALIPSVIILSLAIAVIAVLGMPHGFPAKQIDNTPTATISPASQLPTGIEIQHQPTFTATATQQPTPEATEIEKTVDNFTFPLLEGDALPALEEITANNVNRMIMLGIWGVGEINCFTLSADGKNLAIASSSGILIYDSETLELEKHLDTKSWVSTIEYSPDGKMILSGDRDGLVMLWDTTNWKELENFTGHKSGIVDLAFSPDGNNFVSIALDNTLIKREIGQEATLLLISQKIPNVSTVAYSSDGSLIITGGNDREIKIWDAQNLNLLRTIAMGAKVVDIKPIAQTSYIAIGGADSIVTLIDLSEKETFQPFIGLEFALSSIAISQDGNILVAGNGNGGFVAWDRTNKSLGGSIMVDKLDAPKSELLSRSHVLLFSPDGKKLFSGLRNGIVRVFDTSTWEEIQQSEPLNHLVVRFALSHDSKTGVFQSKDKTITVWDINQGIPKYKVPGELIPGTVISANNRYFAAIIDQSIVKVYDISTGNEINSLNGHTNVQTINFIRNDYFLAVGNVQTMRLWSIASGQEIKTTRNFNQYGCATIYNLNDEPFLFITAYNYAFENSAYNSALCHFQKVDWGRDVFFINEDTGQVIVGGNKKLEIYNFSGIDNKIQMNGANQLKIARIAVNSKGYLLAAALDDNSIHIWNIESRVKIMRLTGHESSITDLHFTDDGKILISSSLDGTIRLWGIP